MKNLVYCQYLEQCKLSCVSSFGIFYLSSFLFSLLVSWMVSKYFVGCVYLHLINLMSIVVNEKYIIVYCLRYKSELCNNRKRRVVIHWSA